MTDKHKHEITISNRTVVRIILLIVGTIFVIQFALSITNILVLIVVSLFLALALNPAVSWIREKLRLKSRITATAIAYLLVIMLIGSLISYVVPPLVRQTINFIEDVPQTIENLRTSDNAAGRFVQNNGLDEQLDGFIRNIEDRTADIQEPLIANAGKVGSALVSIITVLVLTFMMLVEGPIWAKRYWKLQTKARREHQQVLAERMYRVVTGYVNGQLLLSLIAATFSFFIITIASTLLDVSINALALAGILVFTGLIPMIGSTIGGIIVTLACLFVSTPLAIIVAIFYILYQQIENVSLQPYIQAKYNELTPLLVFVAALIGIGFGGFLGALIAIPIAGCLKILIVDYIERKDAKS